jgi:hypothetical protein
MKTDSTSARNSSALSSVILPILFILSGPRFLKPVLHFLEIKIKRAEFFRFVFSEIFPYQDVLCGFTGIGGGAVEEGMGTPSTVFGSMISTRVPSGSYRLNCRLRLTPVFISIGRV